MKILVVTTYYWPETFRITDLVAGLKARGHDVEVLTGLPNYPAGRFLPGYGLTGPYREEHEGVQIWRVPVVPRGNGGAVRLVLGYLCYPLSAALRALTMLGHRWDVVFVMQLSPVTVIFPAALVAWLKRIPLVAWSQDLWPESVASAGFARSRAGSGAVRALSGWLYHRCDRLLASSRAFLPRLAALGVPQQRLGYLPQWAEETFTGTPAAPSDPGEEWSKGFPVMFAGNLGRVQALDTILDAAELLRDERELRWVFLGDGVLSEWMAAEAKRRGLADCVFLLGRKPVKEVPAYLAKAAAMLVSLKPDDTMSLTVPAKVQSYLAAGRPIIGSLDGEGARVIAESGSGWSAPAGDAKALAALVARMMGLTAAERAELGRRGQAYCASNYSREGCLDLIESELAKASGHLAT
jgi:glycosyltransferase involved in cell wall biosynthesis